MINLVSQNVVEDHSLFLNKANKMVESIDHLKGKKKLRYRKVR